MPSANLQNVGKNSRTKTYDVATARWSGGSLAANEYLDLFRLPENTMVTSVRAISHGSTDLTSGNTATIDIGTPADTDRFVNDGQILGQNGEITDFTIVSSPTQAVLTSGAVIRVTAGGTIPSSVNPDITFVVEFIRFDTSDGYLLDSPEPAATPRTP